MFHKLIAIFLSTLFVFASMFCMANPKEESSSIQLENQPISVVLDTIYKTYNVDLSYECHLFSNDDLISVNLNSDNYISEIKRAVSEYDIEIIEFSNTLIFKAVIAEESMPVALDLDDTEEETELKMVNQAVK